MLWYTSIHISGKEKLTVLYLESIIIIMICGVWCLDIFHMTRIWPKSAKKVYITIYRGVLRIKHFACESFSSLTSKMFYSLDLLCKTPKSGRSRRVDGSKRQKNGRLISFGLFRSIASIVSVFLASIMHSNATEKRYCYSIA